MAYVPGRLAVSQAKVSIRRRFPARPSPHPTNKEQFMGAVRRAVPAGLVALLIALGMLVAPTAASAATGDVGYLGASFTGATNPTADKPQSKLWWNDGRWWANMFDPASTDWHIFYLDRATQKWIDTGVAVDGRPTTSSDTLWDGQYLFIGTHGVRTGTNASSTSSAMNLYRYTYNTTTRKFVPSAGFPKTISQNSSESLTIDKDSSGTVWATWTKVTGTTSQVFLNNGTSNGETWGTPFVMPTTGDVKPTVAVDDISTLVAFGTNRVGVLWSNQTDNTVYWSIRTDGTGRTSWAGGVAVRSNKIADDHLNIKSIQADASGRVFAAVKTSLDQVSGGSTNAAQINLLSWSPGGGWGSTTFGRIKDCHTRPQVVLNGSQVYVFATGPTGTGTCTANGSGAIYMKSTSITSPSFTAGVGTIVMRDAASENLNNVTTTKQSASSASGIVVLAGNDTTKRYWHADVVPGSGTTTPPPAPDTTPPTVPANVAAKADGPNQVSLTWDASTDNVGVASYQVTRGTAVVAGAVTGTSFVDTTVAPNTGYSYTVSAVDAAGKRSAESAPAPVTTPPASTPPPAAGAVTTGKSTSTGNTAKATAVTLTKPADVQAGDVLIAQITPDGVPNITAPAGWTQMVDQSLNSNARLFAFYHVVGPNDPGSWQWTLSIAIKWNGGMTAFRGVNNATPFDGAIVTGINPSTAASTLTLGGVTASAGGMVVGGVGLNGTATTVTPPSGWSEAFEQTNAQVTEFATQARSTAGSTGDATWTFSAAMISVGWTAALKPA
jgi:hypothetical protein